MTAGRIPVHAGLEVDILLHAFLMEEVLPNTGVDATQFWTGFCSLVKKLTPENKRLLRKRDHLQRQIDERNGRGCVPTPADEEAFLRQIGYIVHPPERFTIGTQNVDAEVARIAGPQLVVPLNNARYAINALNARWGSLYDALYGTDALGAAPKGVEYDPEHGSQVIGWVRCFLDQIAPLDGGSHNDVTSYEIIDEALVTNKGTLAQPSILAGWRAGAILLRHHDLHLELLIDPGHPIGCRDKAAVADVLVESAVTAIMDCEDSVTAVDADEKILVYRNWLGLMKGDLTARFEKDGKFLVRRPDPDRTYNSPGGQVLTLKGRSTLFIRNVGHLMTNPMMLLDGEEVQEGIVDAVLTSLISLHDLQGSRANSPAGSIYIVKPKIHGPEEAAFANRLFDLTEDLLALPRHTIKIGVMDEERRTSVNLAAVVFEVRDRIVFINTGFLDRTGDEIHTSMKLGPMIRKGEMKTAAWLQAYETNNVQVGLSCGFLGKAQIGKGMWPKPDLMSDMLTEKIAHPQSGANTAWVPSPTAATLHAIHYHYVSVTARQRDLARVNISQLHDMLTIPVSLKPNLTSAEMREEVENNVQSILGYVVRWIDQGIGCSKVPDIHDVALMEDRATCRISSQHLANWLQHTIVSREEVEGTLRRMAEVVDRQNQHDPHYRPMTQDLAGSVAFQAARRLILQGQEQPSGYTEPVLHQMRLRAKADL